MRDEPKMAALETNFTSEARNSHHLINKPDADGALILPPFYLFPFFVGLHVKFVYFVCLQYMISLAMKLRVFFSLNDGL